MIGWIDTPGYAEDVVAHPTSLMHFLHVAQEDLFIVDYSDSADVNNYW